MRHGFLPADEMVEALESGNRHALFIGGDVRVEEQKLIAWTADGVRHEIDLRHFDVSGDGTKPDFERFYVTDYGHSIGFGDYEVAADYVLDVSKKLYD